jgi:hypothetical protein
MPLARRRSMRLINFARIIKTRKIYWKVRRLLCQKSTCVASHGPAIRTASSTTRVRTFRRRISRRKRAVVSSELERKCNWCRKATSWTHWPSMTLIRIRRLIHREWSSLRDRWAASAILLFVTIRADASKKCKLSTQTIRTTCRRICSSSSGTPSRR